jgi:pimeloyl-ACP methyl ester carboxylesterase
VNPLDGCGHYLHRDAPERFAHEVRSFLDAPRQPSARFVRA